MPDDWKPSSKQHKDQPDFKDWDNPGGWDEYCCRPDILKSGFRSFKLPTNLIPVPANNEGKRIVNDWEFFYKGWYCDETTYRDHASPEELFPSDRLGCLDYQLIKDLGCSKERILNPDPLFFMQLVFPIGDPKKMKHLSGIADPRKPYYTEVQRLSTMYAAQQGLMGSYGHTFNIPTVPELLKFDAVLVKDGVVGKSDGAIHLRWDPKSSCFNKEIHCALSHTRWLQLKRTYKLSDNSVAPKKGQPGYEPAHKYDMILLRCSEGFDESDNRIGNRNRLDIMWILRKLQLILKVSSTSKIHRNVRFVAETPIGVAPYVLANLLCISTRKPVNTRGRDV